MIRNAPEWCTCGAPVKDEGDRWLCTGCNRVMGGCVCVGGAKHTRKDGSDFDIIQPQPQPHGTGAPVGERLIELIRERTKLGIEKYGEALTTYNGRDAMLDALQESIDLNQYLMQVVMESEDALKIDELLLNERNRVLSAIPECSQHGQCIPHALDWIAEMKDRAF